MYAFMFYPKLNHAVDTFFLNNIDMYIYIPSLKPSQSASKTNKQTTTETIH